MPDSIDVKKHSTTQTILFHLFPGLTNLIAILLLIPLVTGFGFVPVAAGYVMVPVAMIPVQLGILLYIAKKNFGTFRITKLIPFREKSKLSEYLLFVVIIVIWATVILRVLEPLETSLRDGLFSFVPDNIALRNIDLAAYSKNKLIAVAIFGLLVNGILAPVMEELYFRGFLLPRINAKFPFFINAVLFSLYHFFAPWNFFSRLLVMIPVYYWVVKRKNIRFSLIAHLINNIYTGVTILVGVSMLLYC
ncbi:hypothetical protein FACS1894111_11270 [Clostridia bacterium]|nr:hypothetical protein FACS1894111_11270 [Clostridia bacterium]